MKRRRVPGFDHTLIDDALSQTPQERLKDAEELFWFAFRVNPFPYTPFKVSFRNFREYEKWKKKQKNPWRW